MRLFDEKIGELLTEAHPLLRAKFETKEQLPFYNLYRARTAQMAAELTPRSAPPTQLAKDKTSVDARIAVEKTLASKDGRIVGRPDVLDPATATVVDFKSGSTVSANQATDSETRQLRLYAFLAEENGVAIRRGVVERADRTRAEIQISRSESIEEGRRALATLDKYNQQAGKPFVSGTTPSAEACRYCPCIPFCDAFWQHAEHRWAPECGVHIEGDIQSIEGDALLSIYLKVGRGTAKQGLGVITRLSKVWLTFEGVQLPQPGQTIRVTNATYIGETSSPTVFRADRVATALWTVQEATS